MRSFRSAGDSVLGFDIKKSEFTDCVGSISDKSLVRECVAECDVVLHTATLHKPHIATHTRQQFIDTNISGTLNLLEEAVQTGCQSFVYTSTTSTFGNAMHPDKGAPAVWVTEQLRTKPRNIYGVTKISAEDLCELFSRHTELPCVVLRTSRFFAEEDDHKGQRDQFVDANLKVNELLYRRVDIADVVSAHKLAVIKANSIKFGRFIISGTTPFNRCDVTDLGRDAIAVLNKYVPGFLEEYQRRDWKMLQTLDRVYDNSLAREILGWEPQFTFENAIKLLSEDKDYRSELSQIVGAKGYHNIDFDDGPYPVTDF